MINSRSDSEKGFGVFYVLAAMLMLGAVTLALRSARPPAVVEKDMVEITQKRIEAVQKALKVYNAANTKLPCPASNTVSPASAGFGVAVAKCTATGVNCTAGITCTDAVSANSVAIGSVPVRTLNLSDDYMFDGWGRRFIYAVDADYITSTASGSNNVRVMRNGSDITDAENQKYVLVSAGRDGKGAFNRSGQKPVKCRKISSSETAATPSTDYSSSSGAARLAIDEDNCNAVIAAGNKKFFYGGWDVSSAASTNYYDDIAMLHKPLSGSSGSPSPPPLPPTSFVPAGVSSSGTLFIWVDASDINGDGSSATGEPADGSTVGGITNKGNDPARPGNFANANGPTYIASNPKFNGKAALSFDGVDDALKTSGAPCLDSTSVTMFVVLEKTDAGLTWDDSSPTCTIEQPSPASGIMPVFGNISCNGGGCKGVGYYMDNSSNSNKFMAMISNSGSLSREDSGTANSAFCMQVGSERKIYSHTNTADLFTKAVGYYSYRDGAINQVYTYKIGGNGNKQVDYTSMNTGGTCAEYGLGGFVSPPPGSFVASPLFKGKIAELIFYKSLLTPSEIDTINNYLITKYNLLPAPL